MTYGLVSVVLAVEERLGNARSLAISGGPLLTTTFLRPGGIYVPPPPVGVTTVALDGADTAATAENNND